MEIIPRTTGYLSWNALLSTSALTDTSIKRSHCRLPAWPWGLSSLCALKHYDAGFVPVSRLRWSCGVTHLVMSSWRRPLEVAVWRDVLSHHEISALTSNNRDLLTPECAQNCYPACTGREITLSLVARGWIHSVPQLFAQRHGGFYYVVGSGLCNFALISVKRSHGQHAGLKWI